MAKEDIGIFYKLLGAFTLIATVALLGLGIHNGHVFTKIDGLLVAGLLVAGMALLRPDWLDSFVKTLVDKLPFFSYKKPDA